MSNEKEALEKLEDMKRYLDHEVPHYLEDEVKEIELSGTFNFSLAEDVNAEVDVYEVELQSGEKVFAAAGGWDQRMQNVYAATLPDAETTAKVHIYMMCKLIERNNPSSKGLADDIADDIELPERFRKIITG